MPVSKPQGKNISRKARRKQKAKATGPKQTLEEYLALGGKITKIEYQSIEEAIPQLVKPKKSGRRARR